MEIAVVIIAKIISQNFEKSESCLEKLDAIEKCKDSFLQYPWRILHPWKRINHVYANSWENIKWLNIIVFWTLVLVVNGFRDQIMSVQNTLKRTKLLNFFI